MKQTDAYQKISTVFGLLTIVMGAMGLLGWLTQLSLLANLYHPYIPMALSTGLSFIFMGIGLLGFLHLPPTAKRLWLTTVTTAFVVLISLMELKSFYLPSPTFLDSFLSPKLSAFEFSFSGHMSPVTAFLFLITVGSLLLLSAAQIPEDSKTVAASAYATAALALTVILLLSYSYGMPLMYDTKTIPVALTTALGFLFLGIGLILAGGPEVWPLRSLVGDSTRARLLRAFLPIVLAATVAEDWLSRLLVSKLQINSAFVTALTAFLFAIITILVISRIAKVLGEAIDRAEDSLRKSRDLESSFQQQLKALHEVEIEFFGSSSFEDLCHHAVEFGRNRLNFDRLGLWFLSEDPMVLWGSFGTSETGEIRKEQDQRLLVGTSSLAGKVLASRINFAFDPDTPLFNDKGKKVGRGFQGIAALWAGTQIIGIMSMDNLISGRTITDRDCELLTLYASTVGHHCLRMRVEESLRQREQEVSTILDNMPGYAFMKDAQNRYVLANQRYCSIVGVMQQEIVGKTDDDLFPKEQAEKYQADDARLFSEKKALSLGEEEIMEGDQPLTIATRKIPLKDEQGRLVGLIGLGLDISERKRAEERLHRRNHELSLLNNIAIGINQSLDLNTIAMDCLKQAIHALEAQAGYIYLLDSDDQTLILRYQRGVMIDDLESFRFIRLGEGITGTSAQRREAVCMGADQNPSPHFADLMRRNRLTYLANAPLWVNDRFIGALDLSRNDNAEFSQDDLHLLQGIANHLALAIENARLHSDLESTVTELRETQEKVIQHERLQVLSQIASGVAHDINNTLSPVLGYADLLMMKSGWDSQTQRYLSAIRTGATEIASIVARLREFYRKHDEVVPLQPIKLSRLIHHVLSLTETLRPKERIETRIDIPDNLPTVSGLEDELRDAFINLIHNAVDAMPEGGTLDLTANTVNLKVIVEIRDTGHGMTEEVRKRCMEPFFSTKLSHGSGMGLSVVYGILQRHRGEIDIQSAPGKGTSVRLHLPIWVAEEKEALINLSVTQESVRILCVDDEPLVLEFLSEVLTAFGHVVEVVSNGQTALDLFSTSPFDLVITDLDMPYMDGFAVAKAIKARSSETPVMLLTGSRDTRTSDDGKIPPEVDLILGKPVSLSQLENAVASVLRKR